MTPLRIVQINTADISGGAAKVAWKLHEAFRERGHESTLVVGSKYTSDPDVITVDNERAGRGVRDACCTASKRAVSSISTRRAAIACRSSSVAAGT